MAKLTWIGENYDNKGGSSSEAYSIRRAGRDVISKWGPIEVIGGRGGKYYWLGSYPRTLRKKFATTKAAAAFVTRTGHHEAMPVFRQAAVADLGEAEDAFDDPDGMLDFGAHPGFGAIDCPLGRTQRLLTSRFPLGEVARVGRAGAEDRALPRIGRVAPHAALSRP